MPVEWKKYICRRQPFKEILLLSLIRPESIFGMVAVVYQISKKERALIKKYMGVWR
jgi:hypothetical protein